MGGGGGGSRSIGDIKSLIEKAKEKLKEESGRKNVFISFDYDDNNEVNLLRGQAKNDNLPIEFNDWSVKEPINSERAEYIKQKITDRINQSSLTVVYLSDKTAGSDWVKWEIEKSIELGKKVIGVYKGDVPPSNIPSGISKSVPWSKLADTVAKID